VVGTETEDEVGAGVGVAIEVCDFLVVFGLGHHHRDDLSHRLATSN